MIILTQPVSLSFNNQVMPVTDGCVPVYPPTYTLITFVQVVVLRIMELFTASVERAQRELGGGRGLRERGREGGREGGRGGVREGGRKGWREGGG